METNKNQALLPKWLVITLGIFLLAVMTLYATGKGLTITEAFKDSQQPKRTISITAEGKVSATPNLATVNLGVVSTGSSAADVQSKNNQKINQIVAYIKQQGVKAEDITTTNFSVYPQYDYRNGTNLIIGYQANQTVSVKVRGVDKSTDVLGRIIDGAANNGANEVNGVSLSFDDPDNLRQEARKQAISKAKDKAQELAKEAGLSLGKIVTVSETGSGGYPVPMYDYAMGRGGATNEMKSVAPNIQPGSQDITQQMIVVFELK